MDRPLSFILVPFFTLSFTLPAFAQNAVTFKQSQPKAGESRRHAESMSMTNTMKLIQNGRTIRTIQQKVTEIKAFDLNILKVNSDSITKVKVQCRKLETRENVGQGPKVRKSPLVGKSFVIENQATGKSITDGQGQAVKNKQIETLARANYAGQVGRFNNEFGDILPKRPIKFGEVIKVDDAKASQFFNDAGDQSMKVTNFSLRLTGYRLSQGHHLAIFDLRAKFELKPAAGMTMTVDMTGKAEVGANTLYTHLLDMSGPLKVTGTVNGLTLKGAGKMVLKISMDLQKGKN